MKELRVSIADPPPIREWEEAASKVAARYIECIKSFDLASDDFVNLSVGILDLNVRELRAVAMSLFSETMKLKARSAGDRELLEEQHKIIQKTRDDRRRGADNMKARNPKQAAKIEAFRDFQKWESGKERHASGAAFARHVVNKFTVIKATKSVEQWVTKWRREFKEMESEK